MSGALADTAATGDSDGATSLEDNATDLNGDGVISSLEVAIGAADTNNDGKVSSQEVVASGLDANGDGKISAQEAAAVKVLRQLQSLQLISLHAGMTVPNPILPFRRTIYLIPSCRGQ